ncbi:MAG: hypothetical protein WCJ02_11145 [bacterium]
MARITCNVCGKRTDEGPFCNKCGAAQDGSVNPLAQKVENDPFRSELPTQDNPTVPDTPRTQEVGTPVNVGGARIYTSSDEDHHPRSVIDLPGQTKSNPAMHADPPPQNEPFSSTFDDCPWLWVERDRMIFCVENTNGVLRFKISAHAEGIEDVRMRLQFQGGNSTAVPWFKPKCLQSKEIKLNIPPMPPGAHPVDAHLQFIREGKLLKFETTIELYVYPNSSAGKIAESIVFNITNDIKTGHASDVHLSQDAASAFGHFTKNGHAHALTDLLNLMNSDMRAYRREELYDAGCETPSPSAPTAPPQEAITKRLSLMVGGRLLHLIAERRVTLGKNRDNRVVTRRFNQQGVADAQLCERISKFHCTLELDGEACVIHDGGRDETGRMRPSTWGVSWQGVPVKGSLRIPVEALPKKASLGFVAGNVGYDFELAACAHPFDFGKCSSCSQQARHVCSNGRIPALLLRRTDQVPEHYLLVWSCFDLGCVFPECSGMVVCYEQGAFSIRFSGAFGWLVPDRRVGAVEVRPFAQVGL